MNTTLHQHLQDPKRLEASARYSMVSSGYAKAARSAARATATPFAFVCLVGQELQVKGVFGLEFKRSHLPLPQHLEMYLPEQFTQTTNPQRLEELNQIFASKSGWQKHFFAFQASLPLRGADGQVIGAIVVMDEQIRQLEAVQVAMLEDIAEQLITELDLRYMLEQKDLRSPEQEPNKPDSQMPCMVFAVNLEGQITHLSGQVFAALGSHESLHKQQIFKVFAEIPPLLEAICFALLGEEHESSLLFGNESVRLYLHPVRRTGEPSGVVGILIRES
jgi:GAF domain-containing protein